MYKNPISILIFFVEKSILYAKITVSQKKIVLNILLAFYYRNYNNMINTVIKFSLFSHF